MSGLIGYAGCSTALQDLTALRQALAALGVPDDRTYLDKSLTGSEAAARHIITTTDPAARRHPARPVTST